MQYSLHFQCSFYALHKTVVKQVDNYRKHSLWRGGDINARNPQKLHGKWFAYQREKEALES